MITLNVTEIFIYPPSRIKTRKMVTLTDIGRVLTRFGIIDVVLPFVLVFTIVFAILTKTKIFEEKKVNVIIALVLGILFVFPHITGDYSKIGFDPVVAINAVIPSIGLLVIAIVMFMILAGLLGVGTKGGWASLAVLVSLIFVITIFLRATGFIGTMPGFFSFLDDPDIQTLIVIILVFGLIVWFVTAEPSPEGQEAGMKKFMDWMFKKE